MTIWACFAYDITLSMLAYLFLGRVATLTQCNHSQPYFHMYISVLQQVRNIGIAVFAGIAAFSGDSSIRW